jgi:peptide/nickel transport system permease protein
MARFLVRRIALGILVLWAVITIVFGIFFLLPNNVARALAGKDATPQIVRLISHRLGLDRPVIDQYGRFLWQLLHGNLGYSYYHGQSVNSIIKGDLPITVSLALGASIIWLAIGVFTGVVSAIRPRSLMDRSFTTFALFFYSMPTFLLGLLLLYFLYFKLTSNGVTFFPPGEYVGITSSPFEWFRHMLLPWITLALVTAALYTRLSRGSMLDVLGEDYIRTARSKGLSERRVIVRHALRAALTPVVTQFGIDLGTLLGGVIITEQVFSLPGLGFEAVHAIGNQDLPVVIGVTIVASAFIVIANILVDMLYAVLDPRVRLH